MQIFWQKNARKKEVCDRLNIADCRLSNDKENHNHNENFLYMNRYE